MNRTRAVRRTRAVPEGRSLRAGPLATLALLAAFLPACRGSIEAIRERDAEHVFVRGAAFRYVETHSLEARIGDFAGFKGGSEFVATGVGIVVGLGGTGDRGDAFLRVQEFLKTQTDLRAPPETRFEEGRVALVAVESRISPALGSAAGIVGASVRPLGNTESLKGGMLLETNLIRPGQGEVQAIAVGPVLTVRVDRKGEPVETPKLGRIMKIEVRDRPDAGEILDLRFRPVWP
ncbi:MAG: flagellar basal body P-ring protein FlgI, partial [Planctomycetota bacterium]